MRLEKNEHIELDFIHGHRAIFDSDNVAFQEISSDLLGPPDVNHPDLLGFEGKQNEGIPKLKISDRLYGKALAIFFTEEYDRGLAAIETLDQDCLIIVNESY